MSGHSEVRTYEGMYIIGRREGMMESYRELTRLSRCLASYPRLEIVADLLGKVETNPTSVAELLEVQPSMATRHLIDLADAELVSG